MNFGLLVFWSFGLLVFWSFVFRAFAFWSFIFWSFAFRAKVLLVNRGFNENHAATLDRKTAIPTRHSRQVQLSIVNVTMSIDIVVIVDNDVIVEADVSFLYGCLHCFFCCC